MLRLYKQTLLWLLKTHSFFPVQLCIFIFLFVFYRRVNWLVMTLWSIDKFWPLEYTTFIKMYGLKYNHMNHTHNRYSGKTCIKQYLICRDMFPNWHIRRLHADKRVPLELQFHFIVLLMPLEQARRYENSFQGINKMKLYFQKTRHDAAIKVTMWTFIYLLNTQESENSKISFGPRRQRDNLKFYWRFFLWYHDWWGVFNCLFMALITAIVLDK